MIVFFWCFRRSDSSTVQLYSSIHWISHILKGTRKIKSCLSGHPVQRNGEGSQEEETEMVKIGIRGKTQQKYVPK